MKLLVDESIDKRIVEKLRQDGHDVIYVTEMEPSIGDDDVLHRANKSDSLLITADKDFGELIFRQGLAHAGVVLVRLAGLSHEAKATFVSSAFLDRGDELRDAFSVFSPAMIRVRRKL